MLATSICAKHLTARISTQIYSKSCSQSLTSRDSALTSGDTHDHCDSLPSVRLRAQRRIVAHLAIIVPRVHLACRSAFLTSMHALLTATCVSRICEGTILSPGGFRKLRALPRLGCCTPSSTPTVWWISATGAGSASLRPQRPSILSVRLSRFNREMQANLTT